MLRFSDGALLRVGVSFEGATAPAKLRNWRTRAIVGLQRSGSAFRFGLLPVLGIRSAVHINNRVDDGWNALGCRIFSAEQTACPKNGTE
jgi:hypothetical protein